MTDDLRARTYHQAAHAVAAVSFRVPFTSVGLEDEDGTHDLLAEASGRGPRAPGPEEARRRPEAYLHRAVVALAGPEAEHVHRSRAGRAPLGPWQAWWRDQPAAGWTRQDVERARTLVAWIHNPLSEDEADAYLAAARHRTRVLVASWHPVLEKVVGALEARGRLTEDEVKALCWRGAAG